MRPLTSQVPGTVDAVEAAGFPLANSIVAGVWLPGFHKANLACKACLHMLPSLLFEKLVAIVPAERDRDGTHCHLEVDASNPVAFTGADGTAACAEVCR